MSENVTGSGAAVRREGESGGVGRGEVRLMWHLPEPLHAVLSYAPETFEEAAAPGYGTGWRSAGRATSRSARHR